MKIKKYLNNGGAIFGTNTISYVSGFYGETPEWLTSQFLNMVAMTIEDDFATRELLEDNTTVDSELIADVTGRNTRLLVRNKQKYDHLYKLFSLDYNPIWNVDGTERTERTIENENTKSGTGTSTLTHNTNVNVDSTDRLTYDTELTNTYDSSINTTDDSTTTNNLNESTTDNKSRTTADEDVFYNTDKSVTSKDDTGTVGVERDIDESHTGHDTEEKTGTETRKIDGDTKTTGTETTVSSDGESNSGTMTESVTHVRQGNIGITMTQDMARKEIDYSNYIKFIDIVALDVVRNFSIGV